MKILAVFILGLVVVMAADDECVAKTVTTCKENKKLEKIIKTCPACNLQTEQNKCEDQNCKWGGACQDDCPGKSDADCQKVDSGCKLNPFSCKDICGAWKDKKADCEKEENGCDYSTTCIAKCPTALRKVDCNAITGCKWDTTCKNDCSGKNEDDCKAAKCTYENNACKAPTDCSALKTDKATCEAKLCQFKSDCKAEDTCADKTTKDACKKDKGCMAMDKNCTHKGDACPATEATCKTAKGCSWAANTCTATAGKCSSVDDEDECCGLNDCKWVECSAMSLVVNSVLLFLLPLTIFTINQ